MDDELTVTEQERRARMPEAQQSLYGRAPDLREAVVAVVRRVPPRPPLGDALSAPARNFVR